MLYKCAFIYILVKYENLFYFLLIKIAALLGYEYLCERNTSNDSQT